MLVSKTEQHVCGSKQPLSPHYQLRKFSSSLEDKDIPGRTCVGRDMAVALYAWLSHFISLKTKTHCPQSQQQTEHLYAASAE